MIKASFVMPVKNGEKFVIAAIESMLGQTLPEIEVVVVNDRSEDKTLELIEAAARKDDRLTVIDLKEQSGVSAARNAGTRSARGEIILPSDADDPNSPDRAQNAINELKRNQADIFYSNLERFYTDAKQFEPRHFQPYDAKLLRYINYIAHAGSSAYHKYVFESIGGYDETIKIGEDYDFWLKAQEKGFKFCSKNIFSAQYTMHQSQVTNINSEEKIAERQKWNRIVREKHSIFDIDVNYVKRRAEPAVLDFYFIKNYSIWFSPESIPKKAW